jgi:hypothetical protein
MHGFVYTSYDKGTYSSPTSTLALQKLASTNVRVIELMATYYVDNSVNATSIHATQSTPTDADILRAIADAHAAGLQVALKPHIDSLDQVWRANIGTHFTTEQQWSDWFASYTAFILHFCGLYVQGGVTSGFNVGTELDGTHWREAQWRAVIAAARAALPAGTPLWLGPNWSWNNTQGYRNVHFWDALDFLGVDMYHPLASHADPTLQEAIAGWGPIVADLQDFWQAAGGKKGFVLAEIGYASYPQAATNPPGCCSGRPDEATQSILYQSFFSAVWGQPFFAGVFWWAWDASHAQAVACTTDFEILGKAAQTIVRNAYGSSSDGSSGSGSGGVYSNGATSWADWSWGSSVNLKDAQQPFPGHTYSASARLGAEYGALALRAPSPFNLSAYTALEFNLHADGSPQSYALEVFLCACDDCSSESPQCPKLPAVQVGTYSPASSPCDVPSSWAGSTYSVPLADLLGGPVGAAPTISRVQWGGKGNLTFAVDNVAFN